VVGVRALDAVHSPGILRLAPAKERRGRAATTLLQVGYLQSVEVGVLRIGDARLSTKVQPTQRHPVAGVGVGGNNQSSRLIDHAISGQYVGGRAGLGGPHVQFVGRHVQFQEQVLQGADAGLR
jgi:hypothetical protein